MNQTLLNPVFFFLNGAACMGALVCGLFFFRIWTKSGDRLFAIFGTAFFILGIERIVSLPAAPLELEGRTIYFFIRFLAFLMIFLGILDKNRSRKKTEAHGH